MAEELGLRPLFSAIDDDDSEDNEHDLSLVERKCRRYRSDQARSLLEMDEVNVLELDEVNVLESASRQRRGLRTETNLDLTERESETGAVVWDGAVRLALDLKKSKIASGKSILELGAGCGLCGLVSAKDAKSVVLTDLLHRLEPLRASVQLNKSPVQVLELDWCDTRRSVHLFQKTQFDLILCADCVYDLPLLNPLLYTLRRALSAKKNAIALLTYDTSIGRTKAYQAFQQRALRTFRICSQLRKGRVSSWQIQDPLPTCVLVYGVCGCGKTTVGGALSAALSLLAHDALFIDADALHPPSNLYKMEHSIPLTDDDRAGWLKACANAVLAVPKTSTVFLACSALKRKYRRSLLEDISKTRRLVSVFLKIPAETIKKRLELRKDHFMPLSLVDSQFADLEEDEDDESGHYDRLILDSTQPVDTLVQKVLYEALLPIPPID